MQSEVDIENFYKPQHKTSVHALNIVLKLLGDFVDQFTLIALNTRIRKHQNGFWTFVYPNGEKGQLDCLLGWKKWRNSFEDCQSYDSFDTVGSDHRIVSCKPVISYGKCISSLGISFSKIDCENSNYRPNSSSLSNL